MPDERARIARELHDAPGHQLSMIKVRAGVALHLNPELPAQPRSSLAAINQASTEALRELRAVLDILRQQHEPTARSPTATLARLDALVAQEAAAGLQVGIEVDGEMRGLPLGVDVAALGGELQAGPRPGGGFRARASLPRGRPTAGRPSDRQWFLHEIPFRAWRLATRSPASWPSTWPTRSGRHMTAASTC